MAACSPRRPALYAGLASLMLYPANSLAGETDLPTGGQVAAGTATIASSNGQMLINQSSPRAVIDWSSFNIGQQSGVTFDMPGTSAAVLNRVTGTTPTTIAGKLIANGQAYLVNPNGIAITATGTVKVGGGFTASTLDLGTDDFMQGRLTFSGNSPASITHAGRIEAAEGGFAALIARGGIDNRGLISVPMGRVALGTGSAITLDPTGTGFMQIIAPAMDEDDGTIRSSGTIEAEGGRVEIKAASAAKAVRDIVNISGEVSVASVRKQGGTIILDSGSSGLRLSGKLNASSQQAKGGRIGIGGKRITLKAARVDAMGASGGVVSLGGGRQGAAIPGVTTASSVSIDDTSVIDASALADSGGEIIVWSNENTRFLGSIFATGLAGDGGAAEVSSLGAYEFAGRVNLLSKEGRAGDLLLDPYDVVISTGADANHTGFTATASGAVINAASLEAVLAGASVTVLTGSSGSEAGTITVQSPVSWSANTSLTLDAAGSIVLNAPLTASGTASGITLTAAGTGGISGAGSIASNGTLTFNVNAAAATGTHTGVISGTGQLVKGGSGLLTLAGANSYTGATTINAGTLRASSYTALGVTASSTISGTFDMAGYAADIGAVAGMGIITNSGGAATLTLGRGTVSRAFGGTIEDGAGSISIVKTGAASQTLDGPNRFTGSITVNSAIFQIRGGGGLNNGNYAGDITIGAAGSLRYSSGTNQTLSGNISGAGTLTKDGSTSVLTLSNASGFTGSLNITAGTVRAASANGFGSATVSVGTGTTLDLAGFSTALGSLSGAGTITNTGNAATLTAGALNTSTTFSGILQNGVGTLALTKTGTGTLTLSGANTYTGQTTISGGTLTLSGSGVIVGDIAVGPGSMLSFSRTPFTYAGVISGPGSMGFSNGMTFTGNNTFTGNGQVCTGCTITIGDGATSGTLNANLFFYAGTSLIFNRSDTSTFSGSITGNATIIKNGAGTLIVTGTFATPTATINAGTLQIGNGGTTGSISNTITNNSALVFNRSDALTYAGAISGTGSFTKLGSGTLTLTGTNTYTGGTTISEGSLQLGSGGITGSIAGSISNAGTLIFNRSDNFTESRALSGAIVKMGTGTMTYTASSGTPNFTISQGTLQFGDGGVVCCITPNFVNNSALIFNHSNDYQYNGTISGSGSFTKQGTGTLRITGANSYTGNTTVGAGTLRVFSPAAATGLASSAGLTVNGTLDIGGYSTSLASLAGSGTITNTGAAATLTTGANDANTNFSGTLQNGTGTLVLTKLGNGTLTLSGASTYTGATTITSGTLKVGSATAFSSNSALTVSTGASLDLGGFSTRIGSLSGAGAVTNSGSAATLTEGLLNANTTFSGILQNGTGTLALVKAGTGTLILTGASTYTGGTTVDTGAYLQFGAGGAALGSIVGSIVNNGTVIVDTTANNSNFYTVMSGSGSFIKRGTATVFSIGNHQYTGDTTVEGGTLWFVDGLPRGNMVIGSAGQVAAQLSQSMTYDGIISGSGVFGKRGAATLTFTADNPHTGAMQVTGGHIQFGNGGTSGNIVGAISLTSGSSLIFNRSDNFTFTGTMTSGSLVKNGAGIMVATGALSPASTSINQGTLQIGNGGIAGGISGAITNNGALVFNRSDAVTYAGVVSGTGSLTQAGSGTLTLSGVNTYTGATTVSSGTLKAGSATAFGTNSALTVPSGAITDLGGFSTSIGSLSGGGTFTNSGAAATLTEGGLNASTTFSGVLQNGTGTLGLVKTGTGTLTLTGTNTYTGGTTVNAGATLRFGIGGNTGRVSGSIVNNGLVILNHSISYTYDTPISGSGSLTKIGPNYLTFGDLAYTGVTTISAGTLQLGSGGTVGSVAGNIVNNSALVFNRSDAVTYAGVLSGTGSLTKSGAGTLTLSGANTYTGATSLTAGRLRAGSATAFGSNSALTVSSGATADLGGFSTSIGSLSGGGTFTNSGTAATLTEGGLNASTTFSGVLQDGAGTLALLRSGTGTLTLTGTNTYTGQTTISGGTLQLGNGGTTGSIAGSISNAGTLIFNRSDNFTESRALSGAIVKMGTGTMTYTASSGAPDFTISQGTLQFGDGGTVCCIMPSFVNNAALIFNHSNGYQYGGAITGTGSFTKLGAGTLLLSGPNGYTGSTTVGGGMLTVFSSASAAGLSASAALTVNGALDLGGYSTAVASLAGSGTVTNNGEAATLTVGSNNANTTFSGTLQNGTGLLSLTKTGTGTLTLSGANTHTGLTSVSSGVLAVNGDFAGNIDNSASLSFGGGNATFAGSMSGSGSFGVGKSGTLTLTNDNAFGAATTLWVTGSTIAVGNGGTSGNLAGTVRFMYGGTLIFNRSDTFTFGGSAWGGVNTTIKEGAGTMIMTGSFSGSVSGPNTTIINAGTLQIGNGGTAGNLNGNIVNNSALAFNRANALTFGGIISGTGSLTQAGSGTLTLSSANTYTGATSVAAGTLKAGSATAFGSNSALTVASGATVDLGGFSTSIGSLSGGGTVTNSGAAATLTEGSLNASTTFSGVLQNGTGTLSLMKAGTGTLTLSGTNTHTGDTTVSAGATLQIGNGGATGIVSGSIANSGSVILNTSYNGWVNDFTIGGTGSFTKMGSGNVLMSRNHTYTGDTTVRGGELWFVNVLPKGNLNVEAGAFNFQPGTGSFTYGGSISGAGTVRSYTNGTLTFTADSPFSGAVQAVSGNVQFGNGGTSGNMAGSLSMLSGGSVTFDRSDDFIYSGSISGGTFVKNGAGRLIATGSLSTIGNSLNSGVLQIGNGSSSGTISGNIINNALLELNRPDAFTYGGSISGTGSLTVSGSGTFTLSGSNSYSGQTLLSAGTLKAGSTMAFGNNSALTVATGASLDLGGFSTSIGSLSGGGTVTNSGAAATLTEGGLNANTTFSGLLQNGTGTLALNKTGTGTLTLTSVNTLTGGTTIAAGSTLRIGNGTTGAIYGNISNSGTLIRNSTGSWTPGTISGTGDLQLLKGQMTFDRNQTYTGTTSISAAASLNVGAGGSAGSLAGDVINDGVLNFNRSNDMTYSGVLGGSGGITKAGAGTLTLSGANAYTGATAVTAGTLKAGSATAFGSNTALTVSTGASLDLGGFSTSIGSLSGGGTVTNSGPSATLTTGGANTSTTFSGVIENGAGPTAIVKAGTGTFTLSGANAYTGSTTVTSGTLMAGSVTAFGSNSALTVATGASLDLGGFSSSIGSLSGDGIVTNSGASATLTTGGNSASTSFSGTFRNGLGVLSLAKTGTGTLTLSGGNSYTGLTTISGGRLELAGSWNAGSTAALEVSSGASLSGSGTLTAGMLTIGGEGTVALTGANMIGTLASSSPVGSLLLTNAQSLTMASVQARGALNVTLQGTSSDLTIAEGAIVSSDAAGDAITLSAARRFFNNSGAAAVSTPDGRWLVYMPSPVDSSFNGLNSGKTAIWNTSSGAAVTQSGSRYVFAARPTLTVSSNNLTKTYGEDVTAQLAASYTIAGFDPGVVGAYRADSIATTLSGVPVITSAGTSAAGPAGTYEIDIEQGSLTSLTGYRLSFSSRGLLTVNRAGLTVRARDAAKTYDGVAFSGGNGVTYEGFVNGETEAVLSGSLAYGGAAQGAVNAGSYGLSVSGLTSGNYDIGYADGLLTVNRAGLTVRARDAAKTYDGVAFSGGNGVTYEGFVNGETEAVLSGSLAYGGAAQGAANAGSYGLSVSGLISGNYDISYLDGVLVVEAAAPPETQRRAEPVRIVKTDPGWMGLITRNACCVAVPRMRYAQEWLPETDIIAPWFIEPIEEVAERY